jgi:hypothetical protein
MINATGQIDSKPNTIPLVLSKDFKINYPNILDNTINSVKCAFRYILDILERAFCYIIHRGAPYEGKTFAERNISVRVQSAENINAIDWLMVDNNTCLRVYRASATDMIKMHPKALAILLLNQENRHPVETEALNEAKSKDMTVIHISADKEYPLYAGTADRCAVAIKNSSEIQLILEVEDFQKIPLAKREDRIKEVNLVCQATIRAYQRATGKNVTLLLFINSETEGDHKDSNNKLFNQLNANTKTNMDCRYDGQYAYMNNLCEYPVLNRHRFQAEQQNITKNGLKNLTFQNSNSNGTEQNHDSEPPKYSKIYPAFPINSEQNNNAIAPLTPTAPFASIQIMPEQDCNEPCLERVLAKVETGLSDYQDLSSVSNLKTPHQYTIENTTVSISTLVQINESNHLPESLNTHQLMLNDISIRSPDAYFSSQDNHKKTDNIIGKEIEFSLNHLLVLNDSEKVKEYDHKDQAEYVLQYAQDLATAIFDKNESDQTANVYNTLNDKNINFNDLDQVSFKNVIYIHIPDSFIQALKDSTNPKIQELIQVHGPKKVFLAAML